MIGRPEYEAVNARLNEALASKPKPLIMVHRGTHAGLVVQNTIGAVQAALASGGEIIEIDAARSIDGEFYAFHDGYEMPLLGVAHNLRTLDSATIDGLPYYASHGETKPAPVERLADLYGAFRGQDVLFDVDRTWFWWPQIFEVLDGLDMTDHLILKCPVDDSLVETLAAHPVKYPFTPMVRTMEEALRYVSTPDLNIVGLELIADTPSHDFCDPAQLAKLREHSLFLMGNAEVIIQDVPLYGRYDDEVAIFSSPDKGWGPLFDLGLDVIQTDWPWLLRDYRTERSRG